MTISSSPNSDEDSVPMDESDENMSNPSGPDDTTFPIDGKFYSQRDKDHVLSLPEVDREAILAERAQIVERKQQDNVLRRLYEKNKQEGRSGRKRTPDQADLETGGRRSGRTRKDRGGRVVGEQSQALEAYKEERKKRAERKAQVSATGATRRSPTASDLDAEGESEVEWDSGKPRQDYDPRYDEPAGLAELNRLHVSRQALTKYCYYPTFDKTVKDCYVRLAKAPEKSGEGPSYQIAKILGLYSLHLRRKQ